MTHDQVSSRLRVRPAPRALRAPQAGAAIRRSRRRSDRASRPAADRERRASVCRPAATTRAGNADDGRIRRHVSARRPSRRRRVSVIADVIAPSTAALDTDRHVVAQRRMALPCASGSCRQASRPGRSSPVADFGRLADHHAHAVVDEDALARSSRPDESRCRSESARRARASVRRTGTPSPQRVDHAMRSNRVEARIREDDVEPAARRGVALERRSQVAKKRLNRTSHSD